MAPKAVALCADACVHGETEIHIRWAGRAAGYHTADLRVQGDSSDHAIPVSQVARDAKLEGRTGAMHRFDGILLIRSDVAFGSRSLDSTRCSGNLLEALASRTLSEEEDRDCWNCHKYGPKAEHDGKVLVAAACNASETSQNQWDGQVGR